jgi:hypothetical protein
MCWVRYQCLNWVTEYQDLRETSDGEAENKHQKQQLRTIFREMNNILGQRVSRLSEIKGLTE